MTTAHPVAPWTPGAITDDDSAVAILLTRLRSISSYPGAADTLAVACDGPIEIAEQVECGWYGVSMPMSRIHHIVVIAGDRYVFTWQRSEGWRARQPDASGAPGATVHPAGER